MFDQYGGEPSVLSKIWGFVKDYWTDFCLYIFGLSTSLSIFFFTNDAINYWFGDAAAQESSAPHRGFKWWTIFALVVSVTLSLTTLVFHVKKQKRISTLEDEKDTLQNKIASLRQKIKDDTTSAKQKEESFFEELTVIFDEYRYALTQELEFGKQPDKNERLTFYSHDASYFIPIGRYSSNPFYDTPGRPFYGDSEGIIGKVWEHGKFFTNTYPSFNDNPDEYIQRAIDDGMPREVTINIRMKSRLYFGWRVLDIQQRIPLGLLIVESTNRNRWTEAKLIQIFKRENQKLSIMVERVLPRLPEITKARAEGF